MSQDGFDPGIEKKPDSLVMPDGTATMDDGWLDQLLTGGTLHSGTSEALPIQGGSYADNSLQHRQV